MSNEPEIERYVKDPSLLIDLCREVIDQLDAEYDDVEAAAMDAQLREISKAMENLEKQGISVPDVLRAEKTRLASALGVQAESLQILNQLADDFGEIQNQLKAQVGRDPLSSQAKKLRGRRSALQRTPQTILRELIIETIKGMGGSGIKNEIVKIVGEKLEGKLLPGDLEWRETTNNYVWQNNITWERLRMIKDGVMKSDTPIGVWELEQDYK